MADMHTPLEKAIALAEGMTSLVRKLNERGHEITGPATVYQWKKVGRVPAEYCPDIEGLTGVRCEELRPDVNWGVLRSNPEQWDGVNRRGKAKAKA